MEEVESVVPRLSPVRFVGSSRKDIQSQPKNVRIVFGQAIFDAQCGGKHPNAKPLSGFGSAGVLEIVESDKDGTYRAIYTVKFSAIVYVLHVFKKKSKSGSKTPSADLEKIKSRLKLAESHYADHSKSSQT